MTINKLTGNIQPLDEVDKINEIIDELDNANVAIDNSTITKNASDQLQTVGVIDQHTGVTLKYWKGISADAPAIGSRDANTLYNITDDTDVTLSLLELLYPVGAIYIGTMSTCPLAVLGVGTWSLKSANAIVTGVNSVAPVVGNGMTLGLTDGTNYAAITLGYNGSAYSVNGRNGYGATVGTNLTGTSLAGDAYAAVTTDPDKSGIEANITSSSITVNIWERIQ